METVKLSPKFQVVIPKSIREALDLAPGQGIEMVVHEGRIVMVPLPAPEHMRGYLRGIETSVEREPDRL